MLPKDYGKSCYGIRAIRSPRQANGETFMKSIEDNKPVHSALAGFGTGVRGDVLAQILGNVLTA